MIEYESSQLQRDLRHLRQHPGIALILFCIIALFVIIVGLAINGCSMSLLPKQDNPPNVQSTVCPTVPTIDSQRIDIAKKIDIVGDNPPKCPAPYALCIDAVNADKLRTKLRMLTE